MSKTLAGRGSLMPYLEHSKDQTGVKKRVKTCPAFATQGGGAKQGGCEHKTVGQAKRGKNWPKCG